MRNCTLLGMLALAAVMVPGQSFCAFTWEVHPGVYAAYEYSDNYFGDVRNEQSENIYYVGPSLEVTGTSPSVNLGLTGSYAKSFHKRFPEEDSPEIHLISNAAYTGGRQGFTLSYGFDRTLTRETLSEPYGELWRHTGAATYTVALTPNTSMSAESDLLIENWDEESAEEDVDTYGANIGITHQLDPRDSISATVRQTFYRYEVSPDVEGTEGTLGFTRAVTSAIDATLSAGYSLYNRDQLTDEQGVPFGPGDERINRAGLSMEYRFDPTINISVGGGYNWLVMEDEDRESAFYANASFEKNLRDDRVSMHIAREYSAEFTVDNYGSYDTLSAEALWHKRWLEHWSTTAGISADRSRPIGDTLDQTETDSSAHAELVWEPLEQFTATLSYRYLKTRYETSGTARENRYRMVVEVRY